MRGDPDPTKAMAAPAETSPNEWGIPEYNFENGTEEVVDRIIQLLKRKSPVVVAFCGSSVNVGKTTLFKAIKEKLWGQGIRPMRYNGLNEIGTRDEENNDDRVVIFEQLEWNSTALSQHDAMKKYHDSAISEAFLKIGKDVQGIDLWVGIYRPDEPFGTQMQSGAPAGPIADLLIRNEAAKDK